MTDFLHNRSPWARYSVLIFLLGLIIFTSHFSHIQYLGLYEDDYYYVAETLTYDPPTFWHILRYELLSWPQGRPLGFTIPQTIVFLTHQIGLGIFTLYLLSFVILTINASLVFFIFKKLFKQDLAAFLGAGLFALFPALTTRTFLMHDLSLQISLGFMLLSILLYLSGRIIPSYIFAALILLTLRFKC